MSDLTKIAVDAMGGDGSPKKIIDGIIHNHKSNNNNFFRIFGNKTEIDSHIKDKIHQDYYKVLIHNIFLQSILFFQKYFQK